MLLPYGFLSILTGVGSWISATSMSISMFASLVLFFSPNVLLSNTDLRDYKY